jgi:hypothetical protein
MKGRYASRAAVLFGQRLICILCTICVHVCILVAGRLTIYRRNKKGDNGSPMVVHVIQPALRSLAAAIAADRAAQTGKPPDDE